MALTKTDAVDEEMVELAELDAAELLESVGFEAPIIPVSGVTGEGVDELREALDGLARGPENGRAGALARLPVDRTFVLKGIGLVATGTLWSGEIHPGDTLYTAAGQRPRVRGIQNHDRPAEVARAGARTALDLVGIEAAELEPGDVLLSSPVPATRALDARIQLLESAFPLKHGIRLRLYHGTRATNARVRLLDRGELPPGASTLARLVLQEDLVVLPGDRFVLRSSSPQVTVGGGVVLDPAPTGRRPEPGWLEALESGDWARVVPLALARAPGKGMSAEDLALVVPATPEQIADAAEANPEVVRLGGLYALAGEVEAARDRLAPGFERASGGSAREPGALRGRSPDRHGTRRPFGGRPDLGSGRWGRAESRVAEDGVALPDSEEVPPELEKEAEGLLDALRRAGVEPPAAEATPAARLLLKRGEVVRLDGGLFAASEAAEAVLEEHKEGVPGGG